MCRKFDSVFEVIVTLLIYNTVKIKTLHSRKLDRKVSSYFVENTISIRVVNSSEILCIYCANCTKPLNTLCGKDQRVFSYSNWPYLPPI
jgi:hypothetical protein